MEGQITPELEFDWEAFESKDCPWERAVIPQFPPSPCKVDVTGKDAVSLAQELETMSKSYEILWANRSDAYDQLDTYRIPLTPEGVMNTLILFLPERVKDRVYFKVDGCYCFAYVGQLPNIAIVLELVITDTSELDIIKKIANRITSKSYLVKVFVRDDNRTLVFEVDAYEPSLKHFQDSFMHYINAIEEARNKMNGMREREKLEKDLLERLKENYEANSRPIKS